MLLENHQVTACCSHLYLLSLCVHLLTHAHKLTCRGELISEILLTSVSTHFVTVKVQQKLFQWAPDKWQHHSCQTFSAIPSHLTTQKSGPSATPDHSRKPTHLILNPALSWDWTRWVHSYFRTHPSIFLNAYTAFIQQGAGNYPGQHREQTFTPLGNLGSPANPSFQVRCQLACKHSPTTHWVVRSQTGNREY